MTSAAVSAGYAPRIRMLVMSVIHTKSGTREMAMPGQRINRIVTARLIAPMIVPAPFTASPRM